MLALLFYVGYATGVFSSSEDWSKITSAGSSVAFRYLSRVNTHPDHDRP